MSKFRNWLEEWFGIPSNNIDTGSSSIKNISNSNKLKEYHVLRVQPTPNPNAFQFVINKPIISAGTKTFQNSIIRHDIRTMLKYCTKPMFWYPGCQEQIAGCQTLSQTTPEIYHVVSFHVRVFIFWRLQVPLHNFNHLVAKFHTMKKSNYREPTMHQ